MPSYLQRPGLHSTCLDFRKSHAAAGQQEQSVRYTIMTGRYKLKSEASSSLDCFDQFLLNIFFSHETSNVLKYLRARV